MARSEQIMVLEQINPVEASGSVPMGTILRRLKEEDRAPRRAFNGYQWFEVTELPTENRAKRNSEGWVPLATGLIYMIADEDIQAKTVPFKN